MTPWEHNRELTADRLIQVANLIVAGRNAALDRNDPSLGCDPWTIGCEAFAFQKFRIYEAAEHLDWLEILNPNMEFVFAIGGVPVRFYRGDPAEPHERALRQTFAELGQESLFADDELMRDEVSILYRFAVETDLDGSLAQISFVALAGATPLLTWPIPLGTPVIRVAPLRATKSEGVEIPSPRVSPKSDNRRTETGD